MGADPLLEAAKKLSEPSTGPTDKKQEPKAEEPKAETPEGDTEQEVQKYKVKVDGEEFEVPLDELKLGYMRESDYRKKTSKAAEMRKELESKLTSLDEKVKDAEALLEIDLNFMESEEGKQLREENPEKYLKRVESIQKKADKLKSYKEEKQKRESETKAERIKREQELLKAKISDWLDEDIKAKESKEIVSYLKKQGYTEEEIAGLEDHRIFVTARDAVKLEKIMNQDLSDKETKRPPKSAKPGSSEKKPVKSREDKLRDKLSKSHHMNDAAALLKAKLFK